MTAKYLSQGSYGCIIIPGYDCKSTLLKDNTISKLFVNKSDYEIEYKIQETIKQLDKDGKFTVKMVDKCEITNKDILSTVTNFYKCSLVKLKSKNIYQILYDYGGEELNDIFKTPEIFNVIKLLKSFTNIFEGLCVLDTHDIIHNDIKTNNILYDKQKQKFNLIDFGLYTTKAEVYESVIYNSSYIKYIYYPPEYAFYYYKHYFMPLDTINTTIFIHHLKTKINANLLKRPIRDVYKKAIVKVYDNLNKTKEEIQAIYNNFLIQDKLTYNIDVYMLGLTLYYFIINMFISLNAQNNIYSIPLKLFDLIIKMTEIDPYKRISIHEATKIYKSLFL